MLSVSIKTNNKKQHQLLLTFWNYVNIGRKPIGGKRRSQELDKQSLLNINLETERQQKEKKYIVLRSTTN
jgi:hypothetical protein